MKKANVLLCGAVVGLSLLASAAGPKSVDVLRETGNAFAAIAEQALPAVVYIDVETTIEVPQYGYRYQPFHDAWGRRGQLAIPEQREPKK